MADNPAYREELWDETFNGHMVLMSPRPSVNHNRISGNIYRMFANFLEGKTCEVFGDGVDLYLNDKNRFIPDGMIVCNRDIIKQDGVHGVPDFVVEVLSPSTAKNDRRHKKDEYEAAGVREYWIVDPENRSVEVYLLQNGKFVLDDVYSIYPDYMLGKMTEEEKMNLKTTFRCSLYEDFSISISSIFAGTF